MVDGKKWQILIGYGYVLEYMVFYCVEFDVLILGDMFLLKIFINISVFVVMLDVDVLFWFLDLLDDLVCEMLEKILVLLLYGLLFIGVQVCVRILCEYYEDCLCVLEDSCENVLKSVVELFDVFFQ